MKTVLSTHRNGRSDTESTDGGTTTLQLAISNVASWEDGAERLDVTSEETGEFGSLNPTVEPAFGAPSINGSGTYDSWFNRRVDPSKGDTVWISQFGYVDDPLLGFYGRIKRFAHHVRHPHSETPRRSAVFGEL
jgi:hypothetical protein